MKTLHSLLHVFHYVALLSITYSILYFPKYQKRNFFFLIHLVTAIWGGVKGHHVAHNLYRYFPEKWRPWNWGALYSEKNNIRIVHSVLCIVKILNFPLPAPCNKCDRPCCVTSTMLHLIYQCQLLIILPWPHKKKARNTGNTCNLYLPAPHMVKGIW